MLENHRLSDGTYINNDYSTKKRHRIKNSEQKTQKTRIKHTNTKN